MDKSQKSSKPNANLLLCTPSWKHMGLEAQLPPLLCMAVGWKGDMCCSHPRRQSQRGCKLSAIMTILNIEIDFMHSIYF